MVPAQPILILIGSRIFMVSSNRLLPIHPEGSHLIFIQVNLYFSRLPIRQQGQSKRKYLNQILPIKLLVRLMGWVRKTMHLGRRRPDKHFSIGGFSWTFCVTQLISTHRYWRPVFYFSTKFLTSHVFISRLEFGVVQQLGRTWNLLLSKTW